MCARGTNLTLTYNGYSSRGFSCGGSAALGGDEPAEAGKAGR